MKTPFVSVIMPVFNRADYVRDAIESILEQTLRNLELIVIDDGSTDGSVEILGDYAAQDGRIRLFRNESNQGVATSLNLGVERARGEYIARMDSDDISLCTRLEKQIRFLEDNPDVAACGTWVKLFGELQGIVWELPIDPDTIRSTMLFCGAIAHPAAVIRRTVFSDLGYRFDGDYNGAEDYDLWTRLAERRKLANVPEILFLYRIHPENLSKNATTPSQRERVRRIRHRQLAALGISPSEQESRIHRIVSDEQPTTGREDFEHIKQWCEKLIAANRQSGLFPEPAFSNVARKKQDATLRLNKTEDSFLARALTTAAVPLEFASGLTKQILPDRTTNWVRKRKLAAGRWGKRGLEAIEGTRERFQTRIKPGIKLQNSVPKSPRIGMAVLAHERPDYLAVCLDSLFRTNLYDYDITFLIHDDGSTDPRVREIIDREYDPNYKITRYFGTKGPNCAGAAINRALNKLLAMGSYDIIGWCDPDALFHPEWLDRTMKIALWAKEHHGDHVLGPFSSFHSSDVECHGSLGTYASPYGNYVVKRQMGMLNYFYFTNDFRELGFFVESPDDETLMTEKFARLRVRNFCTETSYVEHIGHRSVLNSFRPVPVKRAVHGLNLASGSWEGDLEKWSPYAYYKFLKPNRGIAGDNDLTSELALDVVIPLHAKDLEIAPLTIASVNKYLRHPVCRMFVVAQPQKPLLDFCKEHNCIFVDEEEVLPVPREDVRRAMARLGIFNRTEWLVQQLIKLECNSFCSEEHVYTIDADTILVRPQKFEHDGKVILLVSDEYHPPYYETYTGILHDAIEPRFSLVTHQMVFDRKRLQELKGDIEGRNGGKPWCEAILENLVPAENSAFSEFETYGNWMKAKYPDSISFEYWFNVALPRGKVRKLEYYTLKYGRDYRSVSFQHYDAA